MPKLSIIVPVYNVEKYLSKCLASAVHPELEDYEIVAVNDGSTDSSPTILAEWQSRYPELIKVVHRENGGLGEASNTGIANAAGDFVAFLDSDDTLVAEAVEEMLKLCEEEFDLCIFDIARTDLEGNRLPDIRGCSTDKREFSLETYPELIFENPSRVNKIYRRCLFSAYNLRYPGRLWYEDYHVTPKFYALADKVIYVNKVYYNYLQQPESIMHSRNIERNLEIIDAAQDFLDFYEEIELKEKYFPQLEYSVFYNVLLTSSTRVNLIDPKSEVQEQLLTWFLENFPNYEENKYVKAMPQKYKLLAFLIRHRLRFALNALMRANNLLRK